MTQKELLYVEDAIGHEKNIISIIQESLQFVEDEEIASFLEKEMKKHQNMEDKMMNFLEGEA